MANDEFEVFLKGNPFFSRFSKTHVPCVGWKSLSLGVDAIHHLGTP